MGRHRSHFRSRMLGAQWQTHKLFTLILPYLVPHHYQVLSNACLNGPTLHMIAKAPGSRRHTSMILLLKVQP